MTEKLLRGYRVIEYTQYTARAHCGRILSESG
jgi:crotonobetainyl-CoA:carnitine CoA-transferase CaiB-like acyl-CoA transferase